MHIGFTDVLIEFSEQIMSRLSLPPLRLPTHDACCGQMRDAERLRDVTVDRFELHDFGNIVWAQYRCDTGWHHLRARDLEPGKIAGYKVRTSVK